MYSLAKFLNRIFTFFILSVVLAGCASSYNLAAGERSPWGGGIATRMVRPGLYYVKVQTNPNLIPNYASAQSIWNEQAALICKGVAYRETMTNSYDYKYDFMPGFKSVSRSGYCICADHQLSEQELTALLDHSFEE
jgi:hypothetical protein